MGAYSRRDAARIAADFDRVYGLLPRLAERRRQLAGTLSGGEQQMLAIGRALMSRPRLLLLDEPSMGLAPLMVQKIFETIRAIAAEGVTLAAGGAEREARARDLPPRLRDGERADHGRRQRAAPARQSRRCGRPISVNELANERAIAERPFAAAAARASLAVEGRAPGARRRRRRRARRHPRLSLLQDPGRRLQAPERGAGAAARAEGNRRALGRGHPAHAHRVRRAAGARRRITARRSPASGASSPPPRRRSAAPCSRAACPTSLSAFSQKAEMVDKFRKANAATKQALAQVLASDAEIAGLVRGSWQDFRDRERLVAAESAAVQSIAEAQRYYFAPSEAQRKHVETVARRPAPGGGRGCRRRCATASLRLDGHVQQLLGAKPVEQELFAQALVPHRRPARRQPDHRVLARARGRARRPGVLSRLPRRLLRRAADPARLPRDAPDRELPAAQRRQRGAGAARHRAHPRAVGGARRS